MGNEYRLLRLWLAMTMFIIISAIGSVSFAEDLALQPLIDEAIRNNHEILMAESKWKAVTFKIPQVKSLPDPMVMFGYQNEGWKKYTYGEMEGAQWMFSASQMFPFPGKLSLKGEMASKDAESFRETYNSVRLKTIARVKELYYELFLNYKELDLVKDKTALFSKIEDAAAARYSTGMAPQQEVLMAQTEKYMLLEKEEMLKQKIQSIEAMLNSAVGRDASSSLGRPVEPAYTPHKFSIDDLVNIAYANSPEIKSREEMMASAKARVRMAEKEYYPDFTLTGSVMKRTQEFQDMWNLTVAMNIPLYYRTKQRQAVREAEESLAESQHEIEATKVMISAAIKDNYSMTMTAEKLMGLYKDGLIPKTHQDFEAALSGYMTGKVEALTVISRLKSLIDLELLYWGQFIEREKAVARLNAIVGIDEGGVK